MPIIKAESDVKKRIKQQEKELLQVSDEAQNRLAEILADSPSIEKLAGTEWEMRPLRMGTQYLIVNEVCKINKADSSTYGDVLKALMMSMPALCNVLTLALLNDKNKIYQNGDPNQGFSKLYKRTYDTIMWNAEKGEMAKIMVNCLQMVDVSFFMDALAMLQIFRASVTEKKRARKKTAGQK
jgi:hypothetical protein